MHNYRGLYWMLICLNITVVTVQYYFIKLSKSQSIVYKKNQNQETYVEDIDTYNYYLTEDLRDNEKEEVEENPTFSPVSFIQRPESDNENIHVSVQEEASISLSEEESDIKDIKEASTEAESKIYSNVVLETSTQKTIQDESDNVKNVTFFLEDIDATSSRPNTDQNEIDPTLVLEDIETATIRPSLNESDRQIFFLETSCIGQQNCIGRIKDRAVCAIESAAHLHPTYKIFVFIVQPQRFGPHSNPELIKKIQQYPNIFLRRLNLMKFALNTPLEDFFRHKRYTQSKPAFIKSHMSDILRFLTLWKYGGIYLDMDVVVLKHLSGLGTNWLAKEGNGYVSSGALNFGSDELGRNISENCLKELNKNFNGQDWGSNGPKLITHVLNDLCQTKELDKMTVEACSGFQVLPNYLLKPLEWMHSSYYFEPKFTNKAMEAMKVGYVAHIFGKRTAKLKVEKWKNVAYALLAKQYCPDMFNSEPKWF